MVYIGIDTGTNTGIALWNNGFSVITTLPIHKALDYVRWVAEQNEGNVTVIFEDARQRKWFGNLTSKQDRDRLIGAGSIKRDCAIWEDALTDWGIPFVAVHPKNNMTKMNAQYFARLTGWKGRTSVHARDAAMLVFGRK